MNASEWKLIETYEQLAQLWNTMRSLEISEYVRTKAKELYPHMPRHVKYDSYVTVHSVSDRMGGTPNIRPGKEISWAEFFWYAMIHRVLFGVCPEMVLGQTHRGKLPLPSARDM